MRAGTLSAERLDRVRSAETVKHVEGNIACSAIRMDAAAKRRMVRGRSVWTGGSRIRQAIHVLEQKRYLWTESGGRDDVPIEDARPEDPGLLHGFWGAFEVALGKAGAVGHAEVRAKVNRAAGPSRRGCGPPSGLSGCSRCSVS